MSRTRDLPEKIDQLTREVASNIRPLELSDREYRIIRDTVYQRVGINLTEEKRSLIVGRLQKIVKSHGFTTFREYCAYLDEEKSGIAVDELVNRISTNHTYFYREKDHFDFFRNHALPEVIERLKQQGRNDLRVWCAASSTGEEAYTLVMLMMEHLGTSYGFWDAGILATDISARALGIAKEGIYLDEQVQRLPPSLKNTYFTKIDADRWQVIDRVKREVTFRRFNLINQEFPFKKPFDIIFCRNVMIYFDQPTRNALIDRMHRFTNPGGYFFIGHSESLGRTSPYRYILPAVYQRPGDDH